MRKTLAVLATTASISVLSACGGSHDTSTAAPETLVGDWSQTNASKDAGTIMKAKITPGEIRINMVSRDSSSIYWVGTFDTGKSTSKSFTTVSKRDTDTISLLGSQAATKAFTYKDGKLSYEFTILGTTSTVQLAKVAGATKPARTATKTPTVTVVQPSQAPAKAPSKVVTPQTKAAEPPKVSLKK